MSAFASKLPQRMTVAEYLAFEETATDRHEFHDGEVLAMSGGTARHSLIAANVNGEVRQRLKGSPCRVLESNMRVTTRSNSRFVYPDGLVVCGTFEFHPQDRGETTLTNPRVVFEVLSPSTEAYDRGEKFNHYRRIESFEEYILVSQRRPLIESFHRQADGAWSIQSWEGLDAVARIRCVEIDLPLAEVYAGVTFEDVDA